LIRKISSILVYGGDIMKIKKVLAFILALTMMLGMSTVALAEAEPALTDEDEGQVIDTALTVSEA